MVSTAVAQIACSVCDTPTPFARTVPTCGGVRICPDCAMHTGALPPGWLSVLAAVAAGTESLSARQAAEIGAWL